MIADRQTRIDEAVRFEKLSIEAATAKVDREIAQETLYANSLFNIRAALQMMSA